PRSRRVPRREDAVTAQRAPGKKLALAAAASLALAVSSTPARATGFHEVGQDFIPREKTELDVSGYLRTRGEALYNLDLDRGLMPNGQPLFPVPTGDPTAQTLTHWDMRSRTD